MKKVLVIGCPGSGKSYFSHLLHECTGLPLFHLDNLFWEKDGTSAREDIFQERLENVLKNSEWIIDGNYNSSMDKRMRECDTIFFLDFSADVCLQGIEERQGTVRSDLPWVEEESDEAFLSFVRNFETESRPAVISLLWKYSWKEIHVFINRDEEAECLRSLLEQKA